MLPNPSHSPGTSPLSRIDIIIPVYLGAAETRSCIESVLNSKNAQAVEIVVVNDASPEPEIGKYLVCLAGRSCITLITNEANLGFVASCNLAMQLHPDRDVVLLNSDTVVNEGWVDRMAACAAATPLAASVTPFSNNATLASYPRIAISNELPEGLLAPDLDSIFRQVNAGRSVEIPTAVGFCMLMMRTVINAIGMFDTGAFGRGYGEENDWCLRASEQGFSHLLCGDVFVYHRGEVSFGGDAPAGKQQAQSAIDQRYPAYREMIARHFETDPARALRRRIDLARLAGSTRPRVLFVTHNWGGGTEKHVNDLAKLLSDAVEVLVLKPHDEQSLALRWARNGEEFEAFFEDRKDPSEILAMLRAIGISRIHLHHVHGLPAYVLNLHRELGMPLDITLHDYFPVTQRYHPIAGGAIESSTDVPTNDWGLTDVEWRQRMGALLASAARVIAPSHDLAARIKGYFPDIDFVVRGHPDLAPAISPVPHKVLVLGGLTVEKGLKVLEACAIDARKRNLPLFFKVIGHTAERVAIFPELPLVIGGTYRDADLDTLIALENADAFLFPSQIPESYSYTLTSALRSNLPIVASNLGAFVERLEGNTSASIVLWNSPPSVWNDALLAAAQGQSAHRIPQENVSRTVNAELDSSAAYARWYIAPISPGALSHSPDANFEPRTWYAPKVRGPRREYSLQQLFEIGVDCGHVPSLNELRRRAALSDSQIVYERDQIIQLQRGMAKGRELIAIAEQNIASLGQRATELESELVNLRSRFVAMRERLEQERDTARAAHMAVISSTTWRSTAVLRSAVEWARDRRAGFGEIGGAFRRLPRDVALARQILKAEGAGALAARIQKKMSAGIQEAVVVPIHVEAAITPLHIDTTPSPRYSLVIPVYGQHLMTFNCLKSVAETCKDLAIEILLIDDCSPEDAAEALASVSGISVVRNNTNLGFLASCNIGGIHAKGEFVVILNNDLILTGDWLQQMSAVYEKFPDTGMVGAKLVYPDGRLQEAGGIVWRDGSAWNVGRGDDPAKPEYNYVREVDYCSGACLLIRREFWNALGGFDAAYKPAYYEDTDLAFRVREAGKQVFYQPHAVVVHFEGQSSGTDITKGIKRHQLINQKTFATRWEKVLEHHRSNGMLPNLERDRYTGKRILVIDACMLTPDQDAGSLRMFEMLALMRTMGLKVSFIATNLEYRLSYVANIQSIGVEVLHHPYVSSLARHIEQHGGEYEIVMLSRETVANQYLGLVKRHAPKAKVIFDTVDLHFLRAERLAALASDNALATAARKTRERELDLVNSADVTLVVSTMERDLLQQLAPRAGVKIVSTIHAPMAGPASFAERDGVLFIGGFRHPPNLDAVTWYVEHVLPILRVKHPGLVTTVIGSNAPPSLQRFAGQDFVIAGFVPNVTAHYNAARLSISPLRYGAGVKGKVNLAMQYGVPVVATTISVEGMHLTHDKNVLVADEPEAFADAIIRMYTDEEVWNRLRRGGLDNIQEWFSRSAARQALKLVLDV